MATVQMNVRIDEEVKARGDEVFARAGLTPSQVVRSVWELAGEAGEVPGFLRAARSEADEARRRRRVALAEEGARIWDDAFFDCGLAAPVRQAITCDDLLEPAYFGKPKEELDESERRLAYYDDLRYEAYGEKRFERGTA